VTSAEPSRLARYQHRTEWWLAGIALVFLALYSVDVLTRAAGTTKVWLNAAMIAVWVCFGVDFVIRFALADRRGRWLFRHLPEVVILLLPMLRPLRLLSLAVVVGVLQRVVGHNVRGRVIAFTAFGAVTIVYVASLAILDYERDAQGTQIRNFGDAIWWAFTTVTTVGYGDTYPVTPRGRLVAVALMIAGVSLLAVVTATLASWIVERVSEADTKSQAATAAQIEELRDEVRKLTESLNGAPYGDATGTRAEEVT
jgi:voltage-gated potassium channel